MRTGRKGQSWESLEQMRLENEGCRREAEDLPANPVPVEYSGFSVIRAVAVVCGLTLLVLILLAGHFHVVSSAPGGPILVRKVHFTLAETFISLDAITGMPFLAAKTKWPLAIKALQRDGYLETDDHFERRIQQEVEAEMKRIQQEVEAEMKQYLE